MKFSIYLNRRVFVIEAIPSTDLSSKLRIELQDSCHLGAVPYAGGLIPK